jgi:5-methylcytosine-specific restriction enzyme A
VSSQFLQPCVVCGILSPNLHDGRCAQHAFAKTRANAAGRLNENRRLQKLRPRVLRRDNWTCVACGHYDRKGTTLQADHIVEWADGGKAVLSNLQTLCLGCHANKTAESSRNRRRASQNPMR